MNQRLMAFWKYDLFPYCLYGEVTHFNDNGTVVVSSYGKGTFRPFLILPYESGQQLAFNINKIANERESKIHAIKQDYEIILKTVLEVANGKEP